jgi:CheY-like chemotaxis protein
MSRLAGRRIIVVDNDPEWLDLIALDLSLEGHEVVARATNGVDALAACAAHDPEVLVVDYRMPPGMSGVAVAQRMRDEHPDIRVVMFSNYEDPAMIEEAEGAGARFVLKTNMRALRAAVADA